jgi:xanthine dehydrogenase accessory factor
VKNTDQRVLAAAVDALASGRGGWLLTIAATFGASPRPLGALAFLDNDGQFTGSLSGGCIEDDLLEKLADGSLAAEHCTLQEYGVTPEENERFGLPCGGRMKVLIEPVAASHLAHMKELLLALNARECRRRCVDLNSGEWLLSAPDRVCPLTLTEEMLQQDFGPRFQLLLVGANELARCISEIATAMDYRVLVCDPRDDRRQRWSLPAVTVLPGMPDDVVAEHAADAHSIVITLTHDPRIDDMALMQALRENCYYVGALGSLRTSEKRRQRLLQLDLSAEQIDRLHAPVGLPIGSKSAMEIAVAVMAELTQLRSGKRAA